MPGSTPRSSKAFPLGPVLAAVLIAVCLSVVACGKESDSSTESGLCELVITTDQADAQIFLDGRFVGESLGADAPLLLRVAAGKHFLRATAPLRPDLHLELDCQGGKRLKLEARFGGYGELAVNPEFWPRVAPGHTLRGVIAPRTTSEFLLVPTSGEPIDVIINASFFPMEVSALIGGAWRVLKPRAPEPGVQGRRLHRLVPPEGEELRIKLRSETASPNPYSLRISRALPPLLPESAGAKPGRREPAATR